MKYIHGGDVYGYNKKVIDFSTNINPFGMPQSVRDAIISSLDFSSQYPDYSCRTLREKIAEKEGVSTKNVICGNGAAELIYNIVSAIKPKTVKISKPSFMEYTEAAKSVGSNIIENGDADIEFLCCPNNPTGLVTEKNKIEEKIKGTKIFVLDECFNDFLNKPQKYSCVDLTKKYNNLIVLKSFTKMYAIPGIRLGYAITSNSDIIEKIYSIRQPWSVSAIAQAAGTAACAETDFAEKTRKYINAERDFFEEQFAQLNIEFEKPSANYIFFRHFPNLKEYLLSKNILIRSCENYEGLDNTFYRAAIKLHDENEKLIKALQLFKSHTINVK